ncbi:sensor histidine kinase [Dyella japonica]|nr:ATP-binding protein [Dyella japonica]
MAAAILVVGSVAGIASFYFAFDEAHSLQDETLRQVSRIITRMPPELVDPWGVLGEDAASPESVVVVRLGNSNTHGACGAPQGIALPCDLHDGFHTLPLGGARWRVLVASNTTGRRLAIAQPTSLRDEIARDGSLRIVMLMFCLLAALVPLMALIVRRMLSPVARLAERLDNTGDHVIDALPENDIPSEVAPFVRSINRLLARLRDSMAQQRRFVADAAHELRSPLAALNLQMQNLGRADLPPDTQARLESVRAGLSRSTHLIGQLLSLARLQHDAQPTPELTSLREVVGQVVNEADAYAVSKHIDLGVERLDAVELVIDRQALHAALRNLVDNAIRYTPPGGRVDIRVQRSDAWLRIEVEDNGPGIPPEDLARVCEPFFRGQGSGETGSGLGLAIVQNAARSMRGELTLASTSHGLVAGLRVPVPQG